MVTAPLHSGIQFWRVHSEEWIRNELDVLTTGNGTGEFTLISTLAMVLPRQPRNSWAVIDHSSCVCRPCTILRGTKCSVRTLWT